MFDRWTDFDQTFFMMNDLRRQMDTSFPWQPAITRSLVGRLDNGKAHGPVVDWRETEEAYFLVADVPGVAKDAVELTLEAEQLKLALRRKVGAPEGYQPIMEERADWDFEQIFTLPSRIDIERAEARLENGVLEIRLPKHPESKPRQIPIHTK